MRNMWNSSYHCWYCTDHLASKEDFPTPDSPYSNKGVCSSWKVCGLQKLFISSITCSCSFDRTIFTSCSRIRFSTVASCIAVSLWEASSAGLCSCCFLLDAAMMNAARSRSRHDREWNIILANTIYAPVTVSFELSKFFSRTTKADFLVDCLLLHHHRNGFVVKRGKTHLDYCTPLEIPQEQSSIGDRRKEGHNTLWFIW